MAYQTLILFAGYEIDPVARTLKLGGQAIPLAPKTFDLLLYLAEHPHQLVTKDELLTALWEGSFVEESNLTQHVFLLRKALGAGGGNQFVVTIPGKGYQFSAPVETSPRNLAPGTGERPHAVVQTVTRVKVEGEPESQSAAPASNPAASRRRTSVWIATAAAVVLVGGVGSVLLWRRLHPVPRSPINAVLAETENSTGDADFDRAVQLALRIDLEQSPFINLLPPARVRATLAEMQRPADTRLDASTAREVCERSNSQAVLAGSLARVGNSYVVLLSAESCVTGKQVAGARAEAHDKNGVLAALDTASSRLRQQLGESQASLERLTTPVAEASTPSLEALRVYSRGIEELSRGNDKTAEDLFKRAVELDPNFAMAHLAMGTAYYNRIDFAQASAEYKKAFDLRERATERERSNIEVKYYAAGIGDLEQAIRSQRAILDIYPQDGGGWGDLCNLYTQLGEYPAAIDAGERALRLYPHPGGVAEQLARAYKRGNRFAEAKQMVRTGIANGRDSFGMHSMLFQIAYVEGDAATLNSEGAWGLTHQHINQALNDLAEAAASDGRLHAAMDDYARAASESLRGGDPDFANELWIDETEVLIGFGETAQAIQRLKQLRGDAGDPLNVASLWAETGNPAPAQRYLAKPDPAAEHDTALQFVELPELRAELALYEKRPQEAIRALEPARPYQLRDYSVPYLRARAETEAGELDAAAADYRLILANPGPNPVSCLYPLSHLGLARVLARQNRLSEAREEYNALFAAWKNADPDLKFLRQAKQEFAALK